MLDPLMIYLGDAADGVEMAAKQNYTSATPYLTPEGEL